MCADIEMQNLLGTYTFKSLSRHNCHYDAIVYALIDGDISIITPRNWTNNFEEVLEVCGGALILITREESSDEITQMLDTYTKWCASKIHEDIKLTPIRIKWVQYAHSGDNIVQSFKYTTLLTGAMFILSGEFPDLHVSMATAFGPQTDIMNERTTALVIATLGAMIKIIFNASRMIEKEIQEKLEKNRETVLFKVSFQKMYEKSRREFLSDLSCMISEVCVALFNMKDNVDYYGVNAIPRHFIEVLETEMEGRKRKVNLALSNLEQLLEILLSNRRRFFDFIDSFSGIFYGTALAITGATTWFIFDTESKPRLRLLIVTCIIGVLALSTRIYVCAMREFWRFRILYF